MILNQIKRKISTHALIPTDGDNYCIKFFNRKHVINND
jgi:hypothetical protein